MESTTTKTTNTITRFASNPYTERAFSSTTAISKDNKWLAYCIANTIVIRSLENLNICKIYTGHKVKTSAVSFAAHNKLIASGDIHGNIRIFFLDDLSLKKELQSCLGGKINGIEWNDEHNKLFLYGDGKNKARCVQWDMGNNIGEFIGHSKIALSGDLRKCRPYRAVTGSEDFQVIFYQGTPFKMLKIHTDTHKNFVTGCKFSPDNSKVISVGFDKRIVLYDGKTGEVIDTIAEDKQEGNHTMAIMGMVWLSNTSFATCSLDRTVKVWDLESKAVLNTLYPVEKESLGIPDSGCAINFNGEYLISVSLSGVLNFWNFNNLKDGALPDKVIDGHQNYISALVVRNGEYVYSADMNGKVIMWGVTGEYIKTVYNNVGVKIISIGLSSDQKLLNVLTIEGNLVVVDLEEKVVK